MSELDPTKVCAMCNCEKLCRDFTPHKRTSTNCNSYCRACRKKYDLARRNDPEVRATTMYAGIVRRCKNADGNHPGYSKIACQIDRESFIVWATAAIKLFLLQHPGQVPSVDRIDPDGHYELSNLRILDWGENKRRARRTRQFRQEMAHRSRRETPINPFDWEALIKAGMKL